MRQRLKPGLDGEVAVEGNSIIEFTHHQFNRLLFDRLGITFREPILEVLKTGILERMYAFRS